MNDKYAVVKDFEGAGAVAWWELSGSIDIDEYRDAWTALGLDVKEAAGEPTIDRAVERAAWSKLRPGQVLRAIGRRAGAWEIETDGTADDGGGRKTIAHVKNVRIEIDRAEKKVRLEPLAAEQEELIASIKLAVPIHRGILTADDISSWLTQWVSTRLMGVALRSRGGFYFIPRDRVALYRQVRDMLRAISKHSLRELPAMDCEEAVAEILTSVRADADAAVTELEDYLLGEVVSTRGINSCERALEAARAKVRHYVELLGQEQPELSARFDKVGGAIQAARFTLNQQAAS